MNHRAPPLRAGQRSRRRLADRTRKAYFRHGESARGQRRTANPAAFLHWGRNGWHRRFFGHDPQGTGRTSGTDQEGAKIWRKIPQPLDWPTGQGQTQSVGRVQSRGTVESGMNPAICPNSGKTRRTIRFFPAGNDARRKIHRKTSAPPARRYGRAGKGAARLQIHDTPRSRPCFALRSISLRPPSYLNRGGRNKLKATTAAGERVGQKHGGARF